MSFSLKLFFTFVIFGIFLALFSVYSFSQIAYERQLNNKFEISNEFITQKEIKISDYVESLDQHLLSIKQNKIFEKFLTSGSDKTYIVELFKTMLFSGHGIYQINYTDKNGKNLIEVISQKIKKNNNQLLSKKLENRVFKKLMNEKIDQVWHSKMGLNIESDGNTSNQKPIFVTGINLGHGVLTFYISIDEIVEIMSNEYYKLLLVDKDCNILIDSKNKSSWSKNFENDIAIEKKLGEKNCDFLEKNSVKTDIFRSLKVDIANNEDDLVLILVYPDFETLIDDEMYYIYVSILISTTVLAIILAYLFSKPMSKMTNKIERLNNRLDRKVEQRTAQLNESLRIIDKYVIRSITDTNGMILDASDAFCNVSGYSKEELVGHNHSIIRHPDMKNKVFKSLWNTITTGKRWDGKIKNLAKNGSYYWVEAHIEPNFINGKIVSYTAIRINISNKVKLEELNKSLEAKIQLEVEKNTEQLELIQKEQLNSVKLSSIGALSAGITHEINTPLTYIKGNFELMKYDIQDLPQSDIRDRILEDTEIITNGLNRISNIIEAMKEVSQTSSENVESVNIYNTLVTSLTLSYNNSKQVTRIYLNGELFDIDIDKNKLDFSALVQKQRIEQVWIVIINNALDELIKVDDYENRRLDINILKNEDKIIVEFIDNAGGIEESLLANIFDPFVSSKARGGMGIGLNVAKKIIDEHCGLIEASNTQEGAKFQIELYAEGAKC